MTQEEILKKGEPIEPSYFETDREEQWYKFGLYEGATANVWHQNIDRDLPKKSGCYLVMTKNGSFYVCKYDAGNKYWDNVGYPNDITYWMKIPQKQ